MMGRICEAVHLAAFCGTGCRSLESEGGTHADALWLAGSILPVDEMTSQDCVFDLVDFAKRQWNEHP